MEISYSSFLLLVPFLYLLTNQIIKKFRNFTPSAPLCLPIIGHLYLLKTPLHRTLDHISNKYGRILLLYCGSRPSLILSSPSAAEECLTKNDMIFVNRPKFLAGKLLGYNYTTLIWASYGEHWRNLKKIANLELLSTSRIQMFAKIRSNEVSLLIQRLLKASDADEYGMVDMKTIFFEFTMNSMMRLIAGRRYYGDGADKIEEAARFHEMVRETIELSRSTNIADFVPQLKWFTQNKIETKMKALQVKKEKFFQDLVEERREIMKNSSGNENGNKNMIDVLLSLQETEPEYYTDEIIKGLIEVTLSAGSDTSSIAMEWALSLLVNNPEVLKKAQQEIDIQVGKSRLLNDSDLDHLPYLQSIIKETLRMYPVAPIIMLHESSQECIIGGFRIPSGTLLCANVWAMQNDPKIWEEPRKFKPERFMGFKGEREDRLVFMPFGQGRRGCPGENLAKRVVGLALGSLLQCFEWERPAKELVDMSESEGSGITMPKALNLCWPSVVLVKKLLNLFLNFIIESK